MKNGDDVYFRQTTPVIARDVLDVINRVLWFIKLNYTLIHIVMHKVKVQLDCIIAI